MEKQQLLITKKVHPEPSYGTRPKVDTQEQKVPDAGVLTHPASTRLGWLHFLSQ